MAIKLSNEARELLQECHDLGGLEIRSEWIVNDTYQELVQGKLVRFGDKRGPGNAWRRMTVTRKGEKSL